MYCPICRQELNGESFCPKCGQAICYTDIHPTTPNTTVVPDAVKKWNWGAFMFNIWWGIGNKTYLPLLCFIPYFNFIWVFVCGFKGNEWAWKKGQYTPNDVEKFLTIQNTWNRGGFWRFILSLCLGVFFILIYSSLMLLIFNLAI